MSFTAISNKRRPADLLNGRRVLPFLRILQLAQKGREAFDVAKTLGDTVAVVEQH